MESSGEETKNGRKRKRKGTNNMDEISEIIPKKQIKAKTVVYPRGTLLALGKIKTEPKKKKKKPKVKVEVEIPKVDNKKRKRKNTDNIDDIAKIKKKENEWKQKGLFIQLVHYLL